jgi:hypothetical protein
MNACGELLNDQLAAGFDFFYFFFSLWKEEE